MKTSLQHSCNSSLLAVMTHFVLFKLWRQLWHA